MYSVVSPAGEARMIANEAHKTIKTFIVIDKGFISLKKLKRCWVFSNPVLAI